jgi:hypothetical protein
MNAPYKPRHNKNKIIPTITHEDFQAFNPDGSLKKGIIKAFLKETDIDVQDAIYSAIKIEEYNLILILHPEIKEDLKKTRSVHCLISCQFREYGHYAIAIPFHSDVNNQPENWKDNTMVKRNYR